MRSEEDFEWVHRLVSTGMNDCAIARATGIPRPTVRDWRRKSTRRPRPSADSPCGTVHYFAGLPPRAYAYLLGMYLGDGCISAERNIWRLRVALDTKYPGIIDACRQAIDVLMPKQHASVFPQPTACVVVSHYSKHWPCLFPQHGPGKKHTRPIRLEPWQQALVKQATEDFIRGLIDSDGCRVSRTTAASAACGTTSRTTLKTSWDCSPARWTPSASRGPATAATPSPSTGRPRPPVWTNSSAPRTHPVRRSRRNPRFLPTPR